MLTIKWLKPLGKKKNNCAPDCPNCLDQQNGTMICTTDEQAFLQDAQFFPEKE